jgi:hypothetical protein
MMMLMRPTPMPSRASAFAFARWEALARRVGTDCMTIAVADQGQPAIGRGIDYTVTWADDTDAETIQRLTPMCAREGAQDHPSPPSWLMLGARLLRFKVWLRDHGCDPARLEFAPWVDAADIASRFASVFGLPGRMGFDPAGHAGLMVNGREFGGHVVIVERDLIAGAELVVRPLAIGDGWVGLVARVGPVQRVLAVKAESAAVLTANLLSSVCRRTRTESLAFLASSAWLAYPSLVALLSRRKVSTGKPDHEAQMQRLGELLGLDSALPCRHLYDLAESGGKAAISLAASGESLDPQSCGTLASAWP